MRDNGVCVPGDNRVDQAMGQRPRHLEDLGRGVARRQVGRIVEAVAAPAGVRRHEDDGCAPRPQFRGLARDRRGQWSHAQSADVRRQCRTHGDDGHDADDPTFTPAASTSTDGFTFGHSTGRPVASSIRFAARNGYLA